MCNMPPQNDYRDTFCHDNYLHKSAPSPLIIITIQMKTQRVLFPEDSKFAMLSAQLAHAQ